MLQNLHGQLIYLVDFLLIKAFAQLMHAELLCYLDYLIICFTDILNYYHLNLF